MIDTRIGSAILGHRIMRDKNSPKPSTPPDAVIDAYKKDIDRTLIRENLKLSPEERILKLMQLQKFADELRRAGQRARHGQK